MGYLNQGHGDVYPHRLLSRKNYPSCIEQWRFAGDNKAVGKATRNIKLVMIFSGNLCETILFIGGRFGSNIYGHIPDRAMHYSDELRLNMGCPLEMQTSEDSPAGFGFIVLDKTNARQELLKVVEVVAFFKITAGVGVYCWFDK